MTPNFTLIGVVVLEKSFKIETTLIILTPFVEFSLLYPICKDYKNQIKK